MIKKYLVILFLMFPLLLSAQSQFQSFIDRVNSLAGNSGAQSAAVDSFLSYASDKGIPFIEDGVANFLYRGSASGVSVAGDFNDWSSAATQMIKLSSTDLFYCSRRFEANARVDYKFVLNGSNWILDPRNPKQISGGFGPNSELAMPSYIQPWEIKYNANIKHGSVEQRVTFSTNVNANYQLSIYLPPEYNAKPSEHFPTVYFQDGSEYISLASALNIIDNLLDSNKIRPCIAVFVKPNNRNDEYALTKRNQYRLFFVNELVPLIDSLYRTLKNPYDRVVLGDSYGGNISTLICFNHPEVFGNLGNHSGAFQENKYETANLMLSSSHKPIRIYSVWGTYEPLYGPWRTYRDSLIAKGYDFKWAEYPEGHSWGLWRATLDDMLKFLLPSAATSVDQKPIKDLPVSFRLNQNYPNPFNPVTTITYSVSKPSHIELSVYDMLGRKVSTLLSKYQAAGDYSIHFDGSGLPGGIYIYTIRAGEFMDAKKLTLLK